MTEASQAMARADLPVSQAAPSLSAWEAAARRAAYRTAISPIHSPASTDRRPGPQLGQRDVRPDSDWLPGPFREQAADSVSTVPSQADPSGPGFSLDLYSTLSVHTDISRQRHAQPPSGCASALLGMILVGG
jgi:hypothetical protein